MASHIAILYRCYIDLILQGRKTVESRLTVHPLPPYRSIQPGDRIYFKASAGPYLATAVADAVWFYDSLTPQRIEQLKQRYNPCVHGNEAYWQAKSRSRYATFVRLRDVEPSWQHPVWPPSRGPAWFVLPDDVAMVPVKGHAPTGPCVDLPVTPGGLRNRYVRAGQLRGRVVLHLPDGRTVVSEITPRGLFRWRGWHSYFQTHRMMPGDMVRLTPMGANRYSVGFVPRPGK